MELKKFTILFSLFLSLSSLASSKTKFGVTKLKHRLSKQIEEVTSLKAQIRSLESDLGNINDNFLNKTKEISALESKIQKMKEDLSLSAVHISENYEATRKILNHYLIDIDDQKTTDRYLKRKIYVRLLKNKIQDLSVAQEESKQLLETVKEYQDRLTQSKKDESAMYDLLQDLEGKKKLLSQKYVNSLEQKNEIDANLEEAIARQRIKRHKKKKLSRGNLRINLRRPIDNYTSVKGSKKGVTFKFNKVSPVFASNSGKVVYAGELASYGKVIMVDHGKEIRSVILGDISIKVVKGDVVNKGDILAYTNSDPGLSKSLYYEVRKKNIAQNTLKILKQSNKNI